MEHSVCNRTASVLQRTNHMMPLTADFFQQNIDDQKCFSQLSGFELYFTPRVGNQTRPHITQIMLYCPCVITVCIHTYTEDCPDMIKDTMLVNDTKARQIPQQLNHIVYHVQKTMIGSFGNMR